MFWADGDTGLLSLTGVAAAVLLASTLPCVELGSDSDSLAVLILVADVDERGVPKTSYSDVDEGGVPKTSYSVCIRAGPSVA